MKRNTIIIALVAGLAGGMLTRYVAPMAVFAQSPAPAVREMRARSFTFVDAADRPTANLSVEAGRRPGELSLVLRDTNGRTIWSAGGIGLLPLSAK